MWLEVNPKLPKGRNWWLVKQNDGNRYLRRDGTWGPKNEAACFTSQITADRFYQKWLNKTDFNT